MSQSEAPAALREAMLGPTCLRRTDEPALRAVLARLPAFLARPAGIAALALWYGPETLATLLASPDALQAALEDDLLEIDRRIAAQLDLILHAPALRRMEGRWRGLHWLAARMDPGTPLRLRVLAGPWRELAEDLRAGAAGDLRQGGLADLQLREDVQASQLYQKIFQAEFNTAGGLPFGLMIIDHEARHLPGPGQAGDGARTPDDGPAADGIDDVPVLAALAEIAAAAFCPMVLGAAPSLLLGADAAAGPGFAPLAAIADPGGVFTLPEYGAWRQLRAREATRFLGIALPRLLARPLWMDDPTGARAFRYREYAPTARERVWMNAAFAFAANVLRAMGRFGWPADVRGVDTGRAGGGLVSHLPQDPFRLGPAFTLPRAPVEVSLRESQERGIDGARETGLIAAGLLPLVALPFGQEPAFGACRSLHALPDQPRPTQAGAAPGEDVIANSRLAGQLNAVLCAARFAHTVKIQGRRMVGRLPRAADIENELRNWLMPYVNSSLSARAELRASRPLVDAAVQVREQADKPGVFACTLRLQPYFQLDTLATSFTFETEFGSAAAPGQAGAA